MKNKEAVLKEAGKQTSKRTVIEQNKMACESFAEGVQLRMHMCYINKGLEVVLYVTSLTNKYPNAKTKKQYLRKQVNKEVNEYRC